MKDWIFAGKITFHCLTGCIIGEVIGLLVGVSLGLNPIYTIILSTLLAFFTGMLLAVISIIKSQKTNYIIAIKTVWLGEMVAIAVMEIAMNTTDYLIGGMNANSVFDSIFWIGIMFAIPIGYVSALPVNYWLIKKHLKKCH